MARPLVIPILGNTTDLEAALIRSGVVAEDASKKIQGSFRSAGLAASDEAKKMGASVDVQAAAAGRAAAAFTEMSAKITVAQRNAGKAAATAAGAVGASVDEQRAAYRKAIAVQSEYEAAVGKAATAAKVASAEQAAAAEAAAAKVAAASAKQAAAVEAAHKRMSSLGKWTIAGGIGIAAVSVKGAVDLQRSMEQIHTQAGASQAEVNKLTKAVMGIAPSLATGPEALAGSLFHVVSGGVPAAKALGVMAAAAKEAKISGADLNDTTTALTSTVFSGISGAQNFAKAMGMLNATVGAGDMHFQDLNEALGGPMLATVKGYGLSLHDVSAALATMGDLNIRGADAATQLRMAVQYMAKPAATAGPLLEKLGLNTHSFANAMANGGLMPALQLLHDHLDKVGVKGNQMAQVIGDLFTKKGASGIDILENSLGKLGTKYTQTGSTANKQNEAWKATTHTLAFQMDQLKATVQSLGDKFGTYLIPKLQAAGNAVKDVIAWMGKHQAAARALAGTIGGVLGLAITVFAYTKAKAFIGATSDMIGGISKLASTIAIKTGVMSATTAAADATMETSNATAGASFTTMGTEAATGAAGVETEVASMAAAVETSDAAIETANAAAGRSFLALLGPIGIAVAAAQAAEAFFHKPVAVPQGGLHFASAAAARSYLQSQGVPDAAIGSLVSQMKHAGDIGGAANAGSSAGVPATNSPFGGAQVVNANPSQQGGAVPVPRSGSNAQRIAGALKAQGFSDTAIAGILGNFAQETGGGSLSNINTRDSGTGASGMGGMGLANWTAGRRTAEMQYATARNESPTSLAAQIGFLVQELRTSKRSAFTAIQAASSPQQAAKLFNQLFEGGTDPNGIREKAAAQAMGMLGGGGGKGLSNAALNALLDGSGSGSGGGKAVMRYVNHRPVGKMTEAQWQAYQAAHPAQKSVRELLYANPFAGDSGVTQGRTDQGVDFSAPAGSKIGAIGAGIIDKIVPNWYKGQSLIEEKLSSGPDKGKFVYYAEQLNALVKQGQQVRAGQTVATVAAHGTGLELGFGAGGGRTLAKATTGYTEGQVTPAGQAFDKFLQSIGGGRYETVKGGRVTGGQGTSIMSTLAHLEQAFTAALTKSADAMAQRFNSLVQSGTIRGLSAALGENSSRAVTTPGVTRNIYGRPVLENWGTTTRSVASRLHSAFEGMGLSSNMGQINRASGSLVAAGAAGSQQDKSFQSEVANLIANGQKVLAEKLVEAHKQAMQALGQEMYAEQALKDAESLQLEATHMKDQTSMTANHDAAMLDVVKAQYQLVNDKANAQVTAIRDMTQTITDQFSGMVQAVEDHTQAMSDAANAVVTGISDNTQTQVDILGERGLFGLNLIAQKLQVQLDQQKTSDDHAIAVAQQNLDAVTAQWHAAVQVAQLNVDQVTAQQDLLAAAAQQRSDTVAIKQEARIAAAQAKMDAVTMHEDVAVVGPAQTAVDMNANAPKAVQDVFNNILKKATGQAGVAEGGAAKAYQGVYDSAQKIMTGAEQTATDAQNTAQTSIATAGHTLATVTGEANNAIAVAQGGLSGAQNAGALAEAPLQSGVSITGAEASTQFAGSGAVINIYGVPVENAGAIGNAASWALRTGVA